MQNHLGYSCMVGVMWFKLLIIKLRDNSKRHRVNEITGFRRPISPPPADVKAPTPEAASRPAPPRGEGNRLAASYYRIPPSDSLSGAPCTSQSPE